MSKFSDIKSKKLYREDVAKDVSEGIKVFSEKRDKKEKDEKHRDFPKAYEHAMKHDKKGEISESAFPGHSKSYEKKMKIENKLQKLKDKADIEGKKAEIAKAKGERFANSRFRRAAKGVLAKAKEKPHPQYKTTVSVPRPYIQRDMAVKQRHEMEYNREYQKKFGDRDAGDGELPFYQKEHMRPLPAKCVAIKKKSFKEELF
jgi:hypothetical protein